MISSISLNVRLRDNKTQVFPLYTTKADFNRAKKWLNLRRSFHVSGIPYRIYIQAYTHTFTNDQGGPSCQYMYSTTTSVTRGLFVWIDNNIDQTDRRIEITGWAPKTETTYPRLEAHSTIVPRGFRTGTDRVYLISNGTAYIADDRTVFGAPLPSFKFYKNDAGDYDLLTFRGTYYINTRVGPQPVTFDGETNTSGGNTYYYTLSDVQTTPYTWSDTYWNPKTLVNGEYYQINAPSKYKSVTAGAWTYTELYLPIVETEGSVSTRVTPEGSQSSQTLYFNESFVTTCEAAKDYGGKINCIKYGIDCPGETQSENILVNTFTCESGENITYTICDTDTCHSDSSKVTKIITRCDGAACATQTNTEANIDPNCSTQGDNNIHIDELPELPDIEGYIDPESCQAQTKRGIYCEVDGDGVTCLGRVVVSCGEPRYDENQVDGYLIKRQPGEEGADYRDLETDAIYCTIQSTPNEDGTIVRKCNVEKLLTCIGDQECLDIGFSDKPCDTVTYEINCDSETASRISYDANGTKETMNITNEGLDPDSDLVKIETMREYTDGTYSITIKYVTEDGTVVGVETIDRNGNVSYCLTGACASDSTAKDYFENPEKNVPCESLQAVVQETITTDTDGEPATSDKSNPKIQNVCNSLTTTVSDGHGGTINITITDQGTLIDADTGEVIPTEATQTPCSGGQTQTTSTAINGNWTQDTITYPDGSTIITNTSTDPTTGQTKTTTTATRPDGTRIDQDWSGTIWITVPGESTPVQGTCWSGASACPGFSGAKICGGGNDQSTGSCTVGAG